MMYQSFIKHSILHQTRGFLSRADISHPEIFLMRAAGGVAGDISGLSPNAPSFIIDAVYRYVYTHIFLVDSQVCHDKTGYACDLSPSTADIRDILSPGLHFLIRRMMVTSLSHVYSSDIT